MNKVFTIFLVLGIFVLVAVGVASNVREEGAVDASKLPQKIEENRFFQRWITNLRNKKLVLEADEFYLKEKNEIYNTKWVKVYSLDDEKVKEEYEKNIEAHKGLDKVVFSPSDREYVDFRNIERDGIKPNEVRFYGQKEDKLLDARILDCSVRANCIFDRAYFLDNDTFVITELSRNIDKKDQTTPVCDTTQMCTYTFKLHFIDLINNARYIYESKPFDLVLKEFERNL